MVDRLIEAGRTESALRLLDLLPDQSTAHDALRAYLAGDDELAVAFAPFELPGLCKQIAARLRSGNREHRLVGAWLVAPPPTGGAEAAEPRSPEDDPTVQHIALFRMCRRRLGGADAEVFERRCVDELQAAEQLRGPRELVRALSFRNVVERGSERILDRRAAVDYAVQQDAVEPLRAAIAKMRPDAAKATARRLEDGIASKAKYAARAHEAPTAIALEGGAAHDLGTFTVESDLVRIGDPCRGPYHPDLDAQFEAENGTWRAMAYVGSMAGQPDRCRLLFAHHEAHARPTSDLRWHACGTFAVDSGMAGVFDAYHFADDEPVDPLEAQLGHTAWYSLCLRHCTSDSKAGTVPFGVVASSGLGDGVYGVFLAHANEHSLEEPVVGVCLVFDQEASLS